MNIKFPNYVLLLLFLFVSQFAVSQNKQHVYYDDENESITADQYYEKGKIAFFILKEIENKNTIKHIMIPRQVMGYLNGTERTQVMDIIASTTKSSIKNENSIIINFFKAEKSFIKNYTKDKNYIKKCEKEETVSQYFISENGFKFRNKKTTVFEDTSGMIQRLFFSNPNFNCGYVIIKPNGYYYVYLGEYVQSKILDTALNPW